MKNIFKNLKPYWRIMILLVLFLIVQAYCDLSLPQYTQDIIDVGIQNKGVEHILPQKIKAQEYEEAQIFMNRKDKDLWRDAYSKSGDSYRLKITGEDRLNHLDKKLLTPIVLTYQLGHMSIKDFKKTVKDGMSSDPAMKFYAERIDDMSVSQIGSMMHTKIKTFRAKDENGKVKTYVDMRPLMQQMIASGTMDSTQIDKARSQMKETTDKIGDQTLKAMGTAYAASAGRAAGLDIDKMQKDYLWHEGRIMIVMALVMLLSAVAVSFFASRAGAGVGRDLRSKVFRNVIGFSSAEMDKFSSASLITRCTNDVQQIQLVTAMMLRIVMYAPVLGIFGVVKVVGTGAHMGWVIALGILVLVGVMGLLVALAMPKFRIMQKLVDALNRVSREILTGLSVIRAFGREDTEEARFDVANTDLKRTQLFTGRIMTFMMPGMMLIMNALVCFITWISAQRIDSGDLQVGAMTAFITYSMIIVMSFLMLSAMSIMLPRAGVAADRIQEVINTETSVHDPEEPLPFPRGRGEVRFEHVDFKYPGAESNVLHDIDFTARPGQVTAIIGSTGSGKSSLVNLIPRFYDVSGGAVTIDGTDVRDIRMHDLRAQIGFVPQKGILFSGSIADNIRFGKQDAADEEVRRAAQLAQATEFIDEKEDGMSSYISQGGSNVSGGQKQRLAIARAIAKQPGILVFDDSFSALDMKTDARLRKVLSQELQGTTQIIVAQRISTIVGADQILVLDEGQMVGKGTHEELMETCEVYRQIALSQLSKAELEGIG
ncbi:MAG: ABC transporter ATP-binding protein [Anaerovoracaceae bacterium]|jgi:ATP-binding cassette subfamily B multidrug efflux pump